MTITFRIENGTGTLPPKAAIVTPDQLASLRDLLAEQAVRLGMTMLLPIHGVTGDPGFELEARICPLALAVVSKCFDHDPDVIAVLEEAQFLGRRVRIWQALRSRDFRIRLSLTPDAAPQLAISEAHAMALLYGLGLDRERSGVIAMTELRDRLTSPRISRRLAADPAMASYVETLTEMAVMKPVEGEYQLAWI